MMVGASCSSLPHPTVAATAGKSPAASASPLLASLLTAICTATTSPSAKPEDLAYSFSAAFSEASRLFLLAFAFSMRSSSSSSGIKACAAAQVRTGCLQHMMTIHQQASQYWATRKLYDPRRCLIGWAVIILHLHVQVNRAHGGNLLLHHLALGIIELGDPSLSQQTGLRWHTMIL